MAAGKFLVAVLLLGSSEAARQLRGNGNQERDQRSLRNTFPFNTAAGRGDHHGGDHHDHGHQEEASSARRSFSAVAAARPGNDGKRCIDKVEMIEETEYDDVVQCDHPYDKRCHTTYVTNYESQQEEECEENFRKNCFIEYEKIAFDETV